MQTLNYKEYLNSYYCGNNVHITQEENGNGKDYEEPRSLGLFTLGFRRANEMFHVLQLSVDPLDRKSAKTENSTSSTNMI